MLMCQEAVHVVQIKQNHKKKTKVKRLISATIKVLTAGVTNTAPALKLPPPTASECTDKRFLKVFFSKSSHTLHCQSFHCFIIFYISLGKKKTVQRHSFQVGRTKLTNRLASETSKLKPPCMNYTHFEKKWQMTQRAVETQKRLPALKAVTIALDDDSRRWLMQDMQGTGSSFQSHTSGTSLHSLGIIEITENKERMPPNL